MLNKETEKKELTIEKTIQVTMVVKFDGNIESAEAQKAVKKAEDRLNAALEKVTDHSLTINEKIFPNLKEDDNKI